MEEKIITSPAISTPPDEKNLFIKEFISGINGTEIGRRYNVSPQYVIRVLQSDGIRQYQEYKAKHKESIEIPKLKKFLRYTKQLGRVPAKHEIMSYDKTLEASYSKFRLIAREKGYIDNNINHIYTKQDFEKMLSHLKELAVKLGHTPTIEDVVVEGKYSPGTYYKHFTTFRKAQTLAGLTHNFSGKSMHRRQRDGKNATKEKCLNDLKRIIAQYGHFPTVFELRAYGKYPNPCYFKLCGSMKEMKALVKEK